jgi:UDP-N-acetylglucosamine--N-acetylmuramyl-(pentapeptide) pyrophosphoryl-undecaprenol N-acetylglucosamine transferase
VLLVTGASQGATSLNDLMCRLVESDPGSLGKWQVLHQTGKAGDGPVRDAYRAARIPAVVVEFTPEIGLFWRAAECAVSRAGAGSVAEAWANCVPTIFLPYPYHRDQHQKFNAAPLVDAGAAQLVTDCVDAEKNLTIAGAAIRQMLRDAGQRGAMRQDLDRLGPADGGEQVARLLLES